MLMEDGLETAHLLRMLGSQNTKIGALQRRVAELEAELATLRREQEGMTERCGDYDLAIGHAIVNLKEVVQKLERSRLAAQEQDGEAIVAEGQEGDDE